MKPFPERVEAVLMAGGGLDKMGAEAPVPSKCFLPIEGVPMAALTLRGLADSPIVKRVILVAPSDADASGEAWRGVDRVVPAGERMVDSFCNGVEVAHDPDDPVLICCGDMPLLTPEAVTQFVKACSARPEVDIWYGYLRKEISEAKFPDTHHTWAKLSDGTFCGMGMMMLRPHVITPLRAAMDSLTRARKNMPLLAYRLGLGTVLAYFFGRLTVTMAEKAGQRILGVTCAGIESTCAETGFNVDDNDSLIEARRRVSALTPMEVK